MVSRVVAGIIGDLAILSLPLLLRTHPSPLFRLLLRLDLRGTCVDACPMPRRSLAGHWEPHLFLHARNRLPTPKLRVVLRRVPCHDAERRAERRLWHVL